LYASVIICIIGQKSRHIGSLIAANTRISIRHETLAIAGRHPITGLYVLVGTTLGKIQRLISLRILYTPQSTKYTQSNINVQDVNQKYSVLNSFDTFKS